MANILKITYSDKPSKYIVKVNKRTIITASSVTSIFNDAHCNKIVSAKSHVERALKKDDTAKVVEIPMLDAFTESMQIIPVFTVTSGNEKTGLKPWHHCFALGDKVFGVIWDTRVIDVIVPMNAIDYSNCKFVLNDNGKGFRIKHGTFSDSELRHLDLQTPTKLSKSQISKISWPS